MAVINPYLNFNGDCKEAFDFYRSVFGGDFDMVMRFSDVPAEAGDMGDQGDLIMHISLPIGKGTWLMGSDTPEHMGKAVFGSNFSISISTESKEEADKLYGGLSAGGQATMPMDNAFWGSYFGMLTDRFGIHWMIGFDNRQQEG